MGFVDLLRSTLLEVEQNSLQMQYQILYVLFPEGQKATPINQCNGVGGGSGHVLAVKQTELGETELVESIYSLVADI